MRKTPMTLRECVPGDIVVLPSGRGRVLVTGANMGEGGTHRLVRPLGKDDVPADQPVPLPTSLLVVEVIKLYYPTLKGE